MAYRPIAEYYSIDEILAGCELVPVIFAHDAFDLGWMDEQAVDEPDLAADTRVEMPWWLASQMAGRKSVALDLPRMLQPAYRAMVLAEPEVVDLQSKAPFFYEFGMMYADLIRELEVGGMLCSVMNARYKEIVRRTVNRKNTDSQEFVARLCNMERSLHEAKAAGLLQYTKFLNRSAIQLTIAPVLATLQSHLQRQTSKSNPASSTTPTAKPNAPSSSSNPNALRNITNGQSSAAARRGAAPALSKPAASQSTLALLTAANSANVPLMSHQKRAYGMAATQQRAHQQQVQNTQRAFDSAAAMGRAPPTAEPARKRKMQQNQ